MQRACIAMTCRASIYDVQLAAGYPVANGIDLIDNWANFITLTAGLRVSLDPLLSSAGPARP